MAGSREKSRQDSPGCRAGGVVGGAAARLRGCGGVVERAGVVGAGCCAAWAVCRVCVSGVICGSRGRCSKSGWTSSSPRGRREPGINPAAPSVRGPWGEACGIQAANRGRAAGEPG